MFVMAAKVFTFAAIYIFIIDIKQQNRIFKLTKFQCTIGINNKMPFFSFGENLYLRTL